MNKICLVVIALFFVSLISSCDSDETSPPTTTRTAGQDSMFFTVDGVAYKFKLSSIENIDDTINKFISSGTTMEKAFYLGVGKPAVGTFSTKGSMPNIYIYYNDTESTQYQANPTTQDSVTVVIAELTPNFKATFHGTLNKSHSSQSGPRIVTITNGSINAKIK